MGSEDFYPEERPVRTVAVDGLWIDEHPVTNLEFGRFVKQTGYVTVAERSPDPADFPGADPDMLVPGSLVFQPSAGPVDLSDFRNWWAYIPGTYWRRPEGPGSNLGGRERHRSCTSRTRTPRRTPLGRARPCRPSPSGSTPRAAASPAPSTRGATSSPPAAA